MEHGSIEECLEEWDSLTDEYKTLEVRKDWMSKRARDTWVQSWSGDWKGQTFLQTYDNHELSGKCES